jgi:shikimate kinase
MKRHIALVGFMTSGKSSVGLQLARVLNRSFYDTDVLIERKRGPIPEIFAREGEASFRRYETQALAEALEYEEPAVVSVGGGTLVAIRNRRMLATHAIRVFIRLSPRCAYERLQLSSATRPLLGHAPTFEAVAALYARRLPHYAGSDFTVNADGVTTDSIVSAVRQWVRASRLQR